MRPSELGYWAALYQLNPWGDQRADRRAGEIAATLANIHRDTKRKQEPFSAADFMPYIERPKATPPKPQEVGNRFLAALGLTLDKTKLKGK